MTQIKDKVAVFDAMIYIAIGMLIGVLAGHYIYERPEEPPSQRTSNSDPVSGVLCPVMHVIDGDTIQVWLDGSVETVRLLSIDTPEMEEPGYQEATQALDALIGRGPVRLESRKGKGSLNRGHYGRLLAYVYLGSKCANVEIVRKGWSEYWTKFGKSRLACDFMKAEEEARKYRRGLWGDEFYEPE